MARRFVDFVSDEDFIECVRGVCQVYSEIKDEIDLDHLKRNTIDPIKMIFDSINSEIDVDDWIKSEHIRQTDKTINNAIGDFHQNLLGKAPGWTNLGTGDPTKVDLKKDDNSVFIELKNKYNTVNSDSLTLVRMKLEKVVKDNPGSTGYWAYILSKKGSSGEGIWVRKGVNNPNIKKIWGKKVYELITGDSDALEKMWKALPIAIKEVLSSEFSFSSSDQEKLLDFFASAFEN